LSSTRKKKRTKNPGVVVEQCPPGICDGAIPVPLLDGCYWDLGFIGEGNEKAHKAITCESLMSKKKGGL